jgi:integrase/recombinase XerD
MVLGPTGAVQTVLELRDSAAKNGSGRRIPLHPQLREALTDLRLDEPGDGPIIKSERGLPMTARSVVNWFANAYRALNLAGCSSHSGRRTFITRAARLYIKPVVRCATCSCSPAINRFRRRSDTSTAIARLNGGWCR